MPIIKTRESNKANEIDYGYDITENEMNENATFATMKKGKFLRRVKENIESDLPYDKLSKEDKHKYNILAGKSKYISYLSFGCLGIAITTAVINGQAVMGDDFLNFSYGIANAIGLTMADSLEYAFTNIGETALRVASVVIPLSKSYDLTIKSDIYNSQAKELLGTKKENMVGKFINKMATRYANKKELEESGAVINPYVSEPEEAPINACSYEELENNK